jgi:hypothetical protein
MGPVERSMPNVYIEARPKGRPEGSHIEDLKTEQTMSSPPAIPNKRQSTGHKRRGTRRSSPEFGI